MELVHVNDYEVIISAKKANGVLECDKVMSDGFEHRSDAHSYAQEMLPNQYQIGYVLKRMKKDNLWYIVDHSARRQLVKEAELSTGKICRGVHNEKKIADLIVKLNSEPINPQCLEIKALMNNYQPSAKLQAKRERSRQNREQLIEWHKAGELPETHEYNTGFGMETLPTMVGELGLMDNESQADEYDDKQNYLRTNLILRADNLYFMPYYDPRKEEQEPVSDEWRERIARLKQALHGHALQEAIEGKIDLLDQPLKDLKNMCFVVMIDGERKWFEICVGHPRGREELSL